jgi:hypothetical protein
MSIATRSSTNIFSNSSDANFRTWVQFISDNLQTGGFIKTTDTGQINTATVTAPGAGSTAQGYEIRKFSDSLQATNPWFMKIEYGSGSVAGTPAIWLTVGTTTDGAGTISTIKFARTQISANSTTATATAAFALAAGTNRCCWTMNYTGANWWMVSLERTKDSAGVDNAEGVLFAMGGVVTNAQIAYLPYTGTVPAAETGTALIPTSGTTLAGANVGVWPLPFFNFGNKVYPGHNIQIYRTNEVLVDTVNALVPYDGVSKNYLSTGLLGGATGSGGFMAVNRNNNAVLMRFD